MPAFLASSGISADEERTHKLNLCIYPRLGKESFGFSVDPRAGAAAPALLSCQEKAKQGTAEIISFNFLHFFVDKTG
ncbi:MAG: hypothetical protein PUA63_08185 [Oscillospiraceae bacterium]|nr:hypothetical protein [Oscillospiraceae bacterium]